MVKANNIAYIYQPHFKTSMFRVSIKEQQGDKENFVVVTCSPMYNGVWKWNSEDKGEFGIWMNGKLPCIEVPIIKCTKLKELTEITNQDIIDIVRKQQNEWFSKEVKNRNYEYKEKPEWFI